MSGLLNASEILEFAIYIEQNGYEFYVESAKKLKDEKLMQLFHFLAEEELTHEKTFKKLQKEAGSFTPPESYSGEYKNYMKDYLKTFTPTTSKKMNELMKKVNTMEDAVQMALGFEKDSVVFYTLLKEYVGDHHKPMVNDIIQEEIKHILKLNNFKTTHIPGTPDVDAL
jgi:rubrerythrin